MVFWNSCCLNYTTRSYNMDGTTNWVASYYEGARGLPETGLRCCVDSEGNVYTCGPCAESSEDDSTWSLISYDPDGGERWRKDLYPEVAARTPFSSRNARLAMCDAIDIICTDDNRIVLLWNGYSGGFGVNVYNQNGSTSVAALDLEYNTPISDRLITKQNIVNLGWDANSFAPPGQTCNWGPNRYLVDTSSSGYWYTAPVAPPYLIGPTIVSSTFSTSYTPFRFKHWGYQWYTGNYEFEFWGVDYGQFETRQNAITGGISASDDKSQIYVGGRTIGAGLQALHAIQDGVGVRFRRGRLTNPGSHAVSNGEGRTPKVPPYVGMPPGGEDSDTQETLVWGQMTDPTLHGLALPDGVAFSGVGSLSPRLEYHQADDGTRIWGHNHQLITGMSLYRDKSRLITIGNYRKRSEDESFV